LKRNLSHILVEHKYEADDLLRHLAQGESFENLAKKYSRCASAKVQGWLGFIELKRLDQAFAEAAAELSVQEISQVIRTRFGYHLIQRNRDDYKS
jgi:peptidyl-prolyl cis-trans isomerase C